MANEMTALAAGKTALGRSTAPLELRERTDALALKDAITEMLRSRRNCDA